MPLLVTERLSQGPHIDTLPAIDAAVLLLAGQTAALACVQEVACDIKAGANVMAAAIRSGQSIHYVAAGSSGLMAVADAAELPGTFGISHDQIRVHMAGGVPVDGSMPGDIEDDRGAGRAVGKTIVAGDVAIILSASGTTPFALEAALAAKEKGARVIGMANNAATQLLDIADVPICLETPPEVLAGSTRLAAGTSQKAALNLMSTLMGIELGHVYQGMMVNVVADNTKLVARAAGIVAQIAGVSIAVARNAIAQTGGDTKTAILVAIGCTPTEAQEILKKHDGHLGPCFESLKIDQDVNA